MVEATPIVPVRLNPQLSFQKVVLEASAEDGPAVGHHAEGASE